MNTNLHEAATKAALAISERVASFPSIAVVLGSGMGAFVDGLSDTEVIPYGQIPHFPRTTVAGHQGNLVVGAIGGARIAALQGRFHYYEGHDLATVTFPVRVLKLLGVRTLILTAATGGIRAGLRAGDLLALSDHLNLIGSNPLRGPNSDAFGTRFPDMSEVYSRSLRALAHEAAAELGIGLGEGVYACLSGPSYETPAEIRMLRTLGADVVGMSTVPEAIVARHGGMDVLAFAIVSNAAAGISDAPITHEEVLATGAEAGPRLSRLIAGVLTRIAD
jgi:purine-nucleoside phosphorylase